MAFCGQNQLPEPIGEIKWFEQRPSADGYCRYVYIFGDICTYIYSKLETTANCSQKVAIN